MIRCITIGTTTVQGELVRRHLTARGVVGTILMDGATFTGLLVPRIRRPLALQRRAVA